MIKKYKMDLNNMKICCSMYNMADVGDYYWFWAFRENLLCRVDKKNFRVEPIIKMKYDEKQSVWGKYREVYYDDGKLLLLPMGMSDIRVIDVMNYGMKDIRIVTNEHSGYTQFIQAKKSGGGFFLASCENNTLYKIDVVEEKIESVWNHNKPILSWGSVASKGNDFLFTSLDDNYIYTFNNEMYTCERRTIGNSKGLAGVISVDNKCWVIPKKTDRIYYIEDNYVEPMTINLSLDGYVPGDWSFYKEEVIDEFIYLLPRDSNMIIRINMNNNTVQGNKLPDHVNRLSRIGRYMPVSHIWKMENDVVGIITETGEVFSLAGKTSHSFECTGFPIVSEVENYRGSVILEQNTYYGGLLSFINNV